MSVEQLTPSDAGFAQRVRDSFAQQRVMQLIGASLERVEAGLVAIRLPYRADLTQQHGHIHAGIITTIADSACGYAAYTLMPEGSNVLSVEFKVNLVRPAAGPEFVAEAQVLKAGKPLTVVRCDVHSIDGSSKTLVATMLGTMIRR
jgi:uncharacterized protein (TIGR00369 family)